MNKPQIIQGDNLLILPTLPEKYFHTCVTSPPYWGLRDYGIPPSEWPEITYTPMPGLPPITVPAWTGCLGLEPTPEMFVAHSVYVFRLVWRVLRDDGTLWLNYGDSYWGSNKGRWGDGSGVVGEKPMQNEARASGNLSYQHFYQDINADLKPKDLVGMPWRVAFALQADGWYLRMDNIWHKPNPMPESANDRPTKAHEYVFLLAKSRRYYYDAEAIMEQVSTNTNARVSQNMIEEVQQRRSDKVPNGWDINPGAHGTIHREGRIKGTVTVGGSPGAFGNPQSRRRKMAQAGSGIKYNDSYENAVLLPVGKRNKRSVWTVATQAFPEAHFATFPEKLIEPCILAAAPVGGAVLDPFGGSGTVYKVAVEQGRVPTIIEIGSQYVEIAEKRTKILQPVIQF